MSTNESPAATSPTLQFKRTENFSSTYANSIIFDSTAWDLRMIFGQLDQEAGVAVAKQHLAVTIPWPQAKLMLFWLRLQVEAAELAVGIKIPIRRDLLPQEPPDLTPEQENALGAKEIRELYLKLREEFLRTI
jgi:hypothetical protein